MNNPADPECWQHSLVIRPSASFQTSLGSSKLSDFPALVRLSTAISGFSYDGFQEADGSDLVFLDSDGHFLDYEIETWDPSGTSLVWVNVSNFTASAELTCRYGGPSFGQQAGGTWRNYAGVWHMNEPGGQAIDSTGHGLTGEPTGTNTAEMVATEGVIGKARINQSVVTTSANQGYNGMKIPDYNAYISKSSKFSIGGWFKASATFAGYPRVFSRKTSYSDGTGFEIEFSNSSRSSSVRGSSSTGVSYNTPDMSADWCYLQYVFNGSYIMVYTNGALSVRGTNIKSVGSRTDPMMIGNDVDCNEYGFPGVYDEVRLYDGELNDKRVKADYTVMRNANAFAYDAVQHNEGEIPYFKAPSYARRADGSLVITGAVARADAVVTATLTDERGVSREVVLGEFAAGASFAHTLTVADGLEPFALYTATLTASNATSGAVCSIASPNTYCFLRVSPETARWQYTVTPNVTNRTFMGTHVYTNFPVLVRLPAEASRKLTLTTNGYDLAVCDETGAFLSYDIEACDTNGFTYVWTKVPHLSAASVLTLYFGEKTRRITCNPDNDPNDVWSNYAGVWHFAPSAAGGTTIADATGHGFTATVASSGTLTVTNGPFAMPALVTSQSITALDYDGALEAPAKFCASGWFKTPSQASKSLAIAHKMYSSKGWYIQTRGGYKTQVQLVYGGSSFFTSLPDVAANWNYFNIISDGTKFSLYLNGGLVPSNTVTYTMLASGQKYSLAVATDWRDEYRIRNGAVSAAEARLEYLTMADTGFFVTTGVKTTEHPLLGRPSVVRNADGSFTATFERTFGEGHVYIVYRSGELAVTNTLATSDGTYPDPAGYPQTYTDTTPLATNRTWQAVALGETLTGDFYETPGDTLYTGILTLTFGQDAYEKGFLDGYGIVTRADTNNALTVYYATNGTAIPAQTYEALPLEVTIPAGSDFTRILVSPLTDPATAVDSSVKLELVYGAGTYAVIDPVTNKTTVIIVNMTTPEGSNIWAARSSGRASDVRNWSTGHVPTDTENIVFGGEYSRADCIWDAVQTVSSWEQTLSYTGTIEVVSTFGGDFPCLTVDNDMTVAGGTLTHSMHTAEHPSDYYRLKLKVGGSFTLSEGAAIDVAGRGSYGAYPGCGAGAYGGSCSTNAAVTYPCWGSLYEPQATGSGSGPAHAGGAVWIEVSGKMTVDGTINADGEVVRVGTHDYAGSGGSIYLKASALEGVGAISASGTTLAAGYDTETAAGGRISVLLTVDECSFPGTHMYAYAGIASYSRLATVGTVVIRTPKKPNGTLYLCDRKAKYGRSGYRPATYAEMTDIPSGQTWKIDGIMFGENALLRIPEGTKLNLPNSLDTVLSLAVSVESGLVVDGGDLILPATNTVMQGRWILSAHRHFEVPGGLTLSNGATIGVPTLVESVDGGSELGDYARCDLAVAGDLTVPSGCSLLARTGVRKATDTVANGVAGVLPGQAHGGRTALFEQYGAYECYDSVFSPELPGNAIPYTTSCENSGGVLILSVDGTFTMNGVANVSGALDLTSSEQSIAGGTGGSIDVTAGALVGDGSFLAEGGYRADACGGGGRIALKLTKAGATFDKFTGTISASGCARFGGYRDGSAGSVYQQSGDEHDKCGTLTIAMSEANRLTTTLATTPVFVTGYDEAGDFRHVRLVVKDYGKAALDADVQMAKVQITDFVSSLDLQGHAMTVSSAQMINTKLARGTYHAGDAVLSDRIVDSVGGGSLQVTGIGTWVFIQ